MLEYELTNSSEHPDDIRVLVEVFGKILGDLVVFRVSVGPVIMGLTEKQDLKILPEKEFWKLFGNYKKIEK